jgi:hypothetical protein
VNACSCQSIFARTKKVWLTYGERVVGNVNAVSDVYVRFVDLGEQAIDMWKPKEPDASAVWDLFEMPYIQISASREDDLFHDGTGTSSVTRDKLYSERPILPWRDSEKDLYFR